jgi:hypothetical protein
MQRTDIEKVFYHKWYDKFYVFVFYLDGTEEVIADFVEEQPASSLVEDIKKKYGIKKYRRNGEELK